MYTTERRECYSAHNPVIKTIWMVLKLNDIVGPGRISAALASL